jgi:hypothetical protein
LKKIGHVVLHEIRVAIPAFLFFLVFFHMLALTRAVANNDLEITALRASAATIGALLVAKSILIVESLPLARWFGGILIVNILWRTFLFGLVVLAFRILEQAVENYSRPSGAKSIMDFFSQSLSPPVLVELGWIFIGMFGFCLIAEYCRLLGGDLVWKVMTNQRIEQHEMGPRHSSTGQRQER